MALAQSTISHKGQTYNVRVIPGAVSGPRHSIRWEADRLGPDGEVAEVIYGDTDNFQDTPGFDGRVQGLLTSALARLRTR